MSCNRETREVLVHLGCKRGTCGTCQPLHTKVADPVRPTLRSIRRSKCPEKLEAPFSYSQQSAVPCRHWFKQEVTAWIQTR